MNTHDCTVSQKTNFIFRPSPPGWLYQGNDFAQTYTVYQGDDFAQIYTIYQGDDFAQTCTIYQGNDFAHSYTIYQGEDFAQTYTIYQSEDFAQTQSSKRIKQKKGQKYQRLRLQGYTRAPQT